MLFFVATIGRSGSNWLHRLISRSESHAVAHEDADPRFGTWAPLGWSPFPLDRFFVRGPNYGEVHGFLRYHLSPQYRGLEGAIPRRAVLERDPRAVIRSWMRNADAAIGPRIPGELAAVCFEVLSQKNALREWAQADAGARIVRLEDLTTDLAHLNEFLGWLGVDVVATAADQVQRENATPAEKCPWEWTPEAEEIFRSIQSRLDAGHPTP